MGVLLPPRVQPNLPICAKFASSIFLENRGRSMLSSPSQIPASISRIWQHPKRCSQSQGCQTHPERLLGLFLAPCASLGRLSMHSRLLGRKAKTILLRTWMSRHLQVRLLGFCYQLVECFFFFFFSALQKMHRKAHSCVVFQLCLHCLLYL